MTCIIPPPPEPEELPMRVKLQLVMCSDDGHEETVTDLVTLQKDSTRLEHLGLSLKEAKQLLTAIQQRVLQQQVEAFLASHSTCADCGASLKAKGSQTRSFRTLFGTFKLASPRLFHCRCTRRKTTSFRPLSTLLTESAAPELLFMETKWASLVSYGLTVDALTDFLPLKATLDVKTVRHDALKVAERCEAELGEEQGVLSMVVHAIGVPCPSRMGRSPWALTGAMCGIGTQRSITLRSSSGERPARPRILWGGSPHAVHCPIRTASISDGRGGNEPS
jgi:hypothetical protein